MKGLHKYFSFFKIRFTAGLQYRAAALGGMCTQFAWGVLTVLLYKTFYESAPDAFPMVISEVISYMWLRQAFLALFMHSQDGYISDSVVSGNVAYELARPTDLYGMWYVRHVSMRTTRAALRFLPIITVAALFPAPYGLTLPAGVPAFIGFVLSMFMGMFVSCAYVMIADIMTFFTMETKGERVIFVTLSEFLSGELIPLPFFPEKIGKILELSPFGAMGNVPFRIYSGNIYGEQAVICMLLQIFWLAVLVITGKCLMSFALKKTVIQGG